MIYIVDNLFSPIKIICQFCVITAKIIIISTCNICLQCLLRQENVISVVGRGLPLLFVLLVFFNKEWIT